MGRVTPLLASLLNVQLCRWGISCFIDIRSLNEYIILQAWPLMLKRIPYSYYLAMVILGTPVRGMSVTVMWNKTDNNWKASRFQRASGPVVFTA